MYDTSTAIIVILTFAILIYRLRQIEDKIDETAENHIQDKLREG